VLDKLETGVIHYKRFSKAIYCSSLSDKAQAPGDDNRLASSVLLDIPFHRQTANEQPRMPYFGIITSCEDAENNAAIII
jgi:hypothetical protein